MVWKIVPAISRILQDDSWLEANTGVGAFISYHILSELPPYPD